MASNLITNLLKAPCMFCDYKGQGYWQLQTHKKNCPFYNTAGEFQRMIEFPIIIKKIIKTHNIYTDAS